mmetsp:Transcript_50097/g.121641  ORF Transcript_50097/g.121641 Transcript_50097/m.121641 type:complete len:259 (+) Transcript_50097:2407-3183(+)
MPALVDCARHALHPVAFRVARGDAHVRSVASTGEGMHRHVHPPLFEIKPNGARNLAAQLILLLGVPLGPSLKGSRNLVEGGVSLDLGGDAADEGSELRLDLVEDFLDAGCRHLRVKHVDGRVVHRHVGLGGAADLPLHFKNFSKGRREGTPVTLGACAGPGAVRATLELRLACGQGTAHAGCLVKPLRSDAKIGRIEGGEGGGMRLELLQEFTDRGVRLGLVDDGGESCLLLGSGLLCTLWHHRLLVPPQKPSDALKV